MNVELNTEMRKLLDQYSEDLQKIYDDQTAGDFTFYDVLSIFARDVLDLHKRMGK